MFFGLGPHEFAAAEFVLLAQPRSAPTGLWSLVWFALLLRRADKNLMKS